MLHGKSSKLKALAPKLPCPAPAAAMAGACTVAAAVTAKSVAPATVVPGCLPPAVPRPLDAGSLGVGMAAACPVPQQQPTLMAVGQLQQAQIQAHAQQQQLQHAMGLGGCGMNTPGVGTMALAPCGSLEQVTSLDPKDYIWAVPTAAQEQQLMQQYVQLAFYAYISQHTGTMLPLQPPQAGYPPFPCPLPNLPMPGAPPFFFFNPGLPYMTGPPMTHAFQFGDARTQSVQGTAKETSVCGPVPDLKTGCSKASSFSGKSSSGAEDNSEIMFEGCKMEVAGGFDASLDIDMDNIQLLLDEPEGVELLEQELLNNGSECEQTSCNIIPSPSGSETVSHMASSALCTFVAPKGNNNNNNMKVQAPALKKTKGARSRSKGNSRATNKRQAGNKESNNAPVKCVLDGIHGFLEQSLESAEPEWDTGFAFSESILNAPQCNFA